PGNLSPVQGGGGGMATTQPVQGMQQQLASLQGQGTGAQPGMWAGLQGMMPSNASQDPRTSQFYSGGMPGAGGAQQAAVQQQAGGAAPGSDWQGLQGAMGSNTAGGMQSIMQMLMQHPAIQSMMRNM